ncbi:MAG: hypothetical protein U9N59_03340 [Campylobacterota bacterium]|nr:hypothetical protein [Campylobacterota bacterium]
MTRTPPPADWVVYVVVLGVVAAMMFGKYLMGRGDKDEVISKNEKPENTQKLEEDINTDVKS